MNTTNLKSQFERFGCQLLFALTVASPAVFAAQGPMDGGGGGAFVCRGRNGSIISSELIDLWEARNRPYKWANQAKGYRLNIPYTNESVEIQIGRALEKLRFADALLHARVVKDLAFVRANIEELPRAVSVAVPPDALAIYYKTDCPAEGMMYFDDSVQVLAIKKEIFGKLINNTNIAAAYTHEAIYKALRKVIRGPVATSDSTPTRRLNACLYSTDDCFDLAKSVLRLKEPGYKICQSRDYDLRLQKVPTKQLRQDGYTEYTWIALITRVKSLKLEVPLEFEIGIESRNGANEQNSWWARATTDKGHPISYWARSYFPMPAEGSWHGTVQANSEDEILSFEISSMLNLSNGTTIPPQTVTCP